MVDAVMSPAPSPPVEANIIEEKRKTTSTSMPSGAKEILQALQFASTGEAQDDNERTEEGKKLCDAVCRLHSRHVRHICLNSSLVAFACIYLQLKRTQTHALSSLKV